MRLVRFICIGSILAFCAGIVGCAQQGDGGNSDANGTGAADVLTRTAAFARLAERTAPHAAAGATAPSFTVDPGWPKPLPNNWMMGDVGGIYSDKNDHIWVYHRPRALSTTDSGALPEAGKDAKGDAISAIGHPRRFGQLSGCCVPAPSIMEFDKEGNLVQAWGGPSDPGFLENKCREQDGCFWPAREHGIYVDHNDFIYISGNGQGALGQFPWSAKFGNDSHVLKFRKDGTFVMAIGSAGAKGPNSNDTNGGVNGTPQPFLPADMFVDPKTNNLYLADGYGNRRVLIVNAETGKYVGHFGAYGQNPILVDTPVGPEAGEAEGPWASDFRKGEMKPKFFRSPLHCVKLANDGMLYVCDRGNNRVQVFNSAEVGKPCTNPNGEAGQCGFVKEIAVAPRTVNGTSGTLDFSKDEAQSCLYIGDLTNDTVYAVNRENLTQLDRFGTGGRQIGQFHWPHTMTVDSEGNVYVGEVDTAGRVQKFLRYGATGCSGNGTQEVGIFNN